MEGPTFIWLAYAFAAVLLGPLAFILLPTVVVCAIIAFAIGTWILTKGKTNKDDARYLNDILAPYADEHSEATISWKPDAHH